MKKSVICGFVVALIFILLSAYSILVIHEGQKYKENDNNNIITEEKTIEKQVVSHYQMLQQLIILNGIYILKTLKLQMEV